MNIPISSCSCTCTWSPYRRRRRRHLRSDSVSVSSYLVRLFCYWCSVDLTHSLSLSLLYCTVDKVMNAVEMVVFSVLCQE